MLRLLTDENLNQRILRGLRQRLPEMDCLVVQHAGMTGFSDEWLLELAAIEDRVIVTHDVNTMIGHSVARVTQSLQMPGLIVVPAKLEIGRAIEDLEVIIVCATESDLKNRIYYLPL
jgi:predicted nuclease of predicted toxin-antitoxin system